MELGQIRLSADVGGTFTDVAAFDETTGELRLGKTLTTPTRLVTGIENGVTKAGAQFRAARLFLHGTTVAINTILERTGSNLRAPHHAGLSRYLRDRPRQSAGILQSVLSPPRAVDRARSALRAQRAHGLAGEGADQARRGCGAGGGGRRGRPRHRGDGHPVPAFLPQSRARAAGQRRSSPRAIPISSSRPRTSCRRNIVSSSAPRPRRRMPMSDRACGAISARWATISMPPASPANF